MPSYNLRYSPIAKQENHYAYLFLQSIRSVKKYNITKCKTCKSFSSRQLLIDINLFKTPVDRRRYHHTARKLNYEYFLLYLLFWSSILEITGEYNFFYRLLRVSPKVLFLHSKFLRLLNANRLISLDATTNVCHRKTSQIIPFRFKKLVTKLEAETNHSLLTNSLSDYEIVYSYVSEPTMHGLPCYGKPLLRTIR